MYFWYHKVKLILRKTKPRDKTETLFERLDPTVPESPKLYNKFFLGIGVGLSLNWIIIPCNQKHLTNAEVELKVVE